MRSQLSVNQSREEDAINPYSTVSAYQSPSRNLQPPPLKFQRNSAKRAVATDASVGITTNASQSDTGGEVFSYFERLEDIPCADYRSISDLIDDVLLMTNFN